MAEEVIDYALAINNAGYWFDSIIDEYCEYHNTVLGLRISCTALAAIFTAIGIFGVIILIKYGKRQRTYIDIKDEEANNQFNTEDINSNVTANSVEEVVNDTGVVVSIEAIKAIAESLKLYKELLDNGIITQEEFDKKKNEILK